MDSAPSQATPPLSLSSPVVAATSVSIAPHQVSASSTTNTPDSNAPSPASLTPSQPADDSQVPTAGPILQPAPLAKPRGKAKKQTPVLALTPEAAEIKFLKEELNNAITKITMLDAEIVDLNKTIKIQQSRLKIFEDNKNDKNAKKYFGSDIASQANSFPSSAPTCPRHSCCCSRPPCCCQSTQHHVQTPDIEAAIKTLSEDMKMMKLLLKNSTPGTGLEDSKAPDPDQQNEEETENPSMAPPPNYNERQDVTANIHENQGDVSIVSIEEFIPDIPANETDLKCLVPTIQLN